MVLQRERGVVGPLGVELGQVQARRQALGVHGDRLLQSGDRGVLIPAGDGVAELLPQGRAVVFRFPVRGRRQAGQELL